MMLDVERPGEGPWSRYHVPSEIRHRCTPVATCGRHMRVVLDCNIWDILANDGDARAQISVLVEPKEIAIVVPATLRRELESSPFGRVPSWFPVECIVDGVAIINHSRVGECRLGQGAVFQDHLGESAQTAHAVIVDTAHSCAHVFVSQDRRARRRYARIAGTARSLGYSAFRDEIFGLASGS